MCGIVGHVTATDREPQRAAVEAATAALAHRGPDGEGVVHQPQASLGHRRLGVIDLAGSAQPWTSAEGRYTLVFNGEIYNYLELRAELARQGVAFRSQGDTEVLLACFVREGIRCLARFNGMFAFAVWDRLERRLTLARDRLGKKPLYYGACAGGLAFASELDALTRFPGLAGAVDPAAVDDYFSYQFIPFERSIYRDVKKLQPGHVLTWADGAMAVERWWTPPRPQATVPADAREELAALMADAVRLRLRSDVPVGAFLSGGIDSAIVVAELVRLDARLGSYAMGFDDASHDERPAARASARFFGIPHHDAVFHLDPALAVRLARRFGEPFADVSALPAWHLCAHARQAVTVALSGDGADELFAGYRRYLAGRWVDAYLRLPAPLRRAFRAVADRLADPDSYFGFSRLKQLKLFLDFADRNAAAPGDCLPQVFGQGERQRLLNPDTAGAGDHDIAGRLALGDLDTVSRMLQADLAAYLPEDILTKIDRVSMDHALEVRSPFLDYRIVEFASRLPLAAKMRGRRQKAILRETFGPRLPPGVLRGPKRGFAVPIGAMLRGSFRDEFAGRVFSPAMAEFLQLAEVERLWAEHRSGRREHGLKLWTVFCFAAWLDYRRKDRMDPA